MAATKHSRASSSNRRCFAGLTTGLVLVSLIATSLAANSFGTAPAASRWHQQFVSRAALQEPVRTLQATPIIESPTFAADPARQLTNNGEDDNAELDQFVGQLMLARKLLDEKLARASSALTVGQQQRQRQQVALDDERQQGDASRYQLLDAPASGADDELGYPYSGPSGDESNSLAGDDLLSRANKLAAELELAKLGPSLGGSNDQQRQQQTNDEVEIVKPAAQSHRVTTNPMFYSVSTDESGEFSGQFGEPLASAQQTSKRQSSSSTEAPTLDQDDADDKLGRRPEGSSRRPRAKLTTLLEEEDDDEPLSLHRGAGQQAAQLSNDASSASTSGPNLYSMLQGAYKRLSSWLPTSWTSYASASAASQAAKSTGIDGDASEANKPRQQQPLRQADKTNTNSSGQEIERQPAKDQSGATKLGVSSVADQDAASKQSIESNAGSTATPELEHSSAGARLEGQQHSAKRVHVEASNMLDLSQMWPSAAQLGAGSVAPEKIDLLRQSSLALPDMAGKYVYAPTQHYYIGSGAGDSASSALPVALGEQQAWRARPAFGFQKATLEPQQLAPPAGPTNNDLYFLVMVGAFCVMAMAVVLAAGLFAYRVQQQRKSSQADQEYPTYGVVGPNNMLAGSKCGAAFMGNYFSGGSGGAASLNSKGGFGPASNAKSGSAKHLSELYARGALGHGAGGSDSGLASLDKICSLGSKKSSASSTTASAAAAAAAAAGNCEQVAAALQHQHQQRAQTSAQLMGGCSLAQSQDAARMYHYQHQKQQMIVSDRSSAGRHTSASDLDSDDDNEDGSYTVYECPGLASAHEMEIKNPLFNDERTP